MDTKKSH